MTEKRKKTYRQRDLSASLSVLTPSQVKVLMLLAKYRYMTAKQMQVCGVAKTLDTIRNHVLYRLSKRVQGNLVQYQDYFATNSNFGRLPYVYALTQYGAEYTSNLLGDKVRYPVGKIQFINDYEHRLAYIDFCIAVDKWAEENEARDVLEMSHYFDKTGANRKGLPSRSVNRLEASPEVGDIEPDGLFLVDTGAKIRAFAVEIHNNTDTKRVVQQLARHSHAINTGAVSKKLKHDKASFVLSVAMTANQCALIKKRFQSVPDFEKFSRLFVFSDIQTIVEKGLSSAFTHADGQPAPIFE